MPAVTSKPKGEFHWSFANLKNLLRESWDGWNKDEASRMGAALAYYSLLSIAPLFLVAVTIAGFVFGQEAATGQLMNQLSGLMGGEAARTIQSILKNIAASGSKGIWASIAGGLTTLLAASTVVGELRSDLNKIWKVTEAAGIRSMIQQRLSAFAIVLGSGVLLLGVTFLSAALQGAAKFVGGRLPLPAFVIELFNFLVSALVLTALFAFLLKFVPDVKLEWEDLWIGAGFTALLFAIGKTLIGLYLGRAGFASTFGAAGSIVLIVVWIYYSAQVFFFGAEFTRAFSCIHGSRQDQTAKPRPADTKEPLEPAWMAQGSPVLTNGPLPPVMPIEEPARHGVLATVGTLIGVALAAGKLKKVVSKEIDRSQH